MRDALGRELVLERPPRRIVSLVPSLTETCYAMGMGGRIVGATEFCVFPPDARAIPRVGGTIAVSAEKVAALMPDLVLASADENRRPQVEELERLGLPVFVTFPKTLPEVLDMIDDVGRILGVAAAAVSVTGPIRRRVARLEARVKGRDCVSAVYLVWRDPWMAAGADTYIDDILRRAGGENAAARCEGRYPPMTSDAMRDLHPEVVLLPSEPYPFSETDADDVRRAVPQARVVAVDGEPINWAGPRIADGLELLASSLHP